MRKDRELLPDWVQESQGNVKTIVSSMTLLSLESHGSKRTPSFGAVIECTSRVPSITNRLVIARALTHSKNNSKSLLIQLKMALIILLHTIYYFNETTILFQNTDKFQSVKCS